MILRTNSSTTIRRTRCMPRRLDAKGIVAKVSRRWQGFQAETVKPPELAGGARVFERKPAR